MQNILTDYKTTLKKYAVFSGRASKAEYWNFVLTNLLVVLVGNIIGGVWPNTAILVKFLVNLYVLAVFVPGLAVSVRRLHDVGKSGWTLLFGFIPVIGLIWLFILYLRESQKGPNEYGPEPGAPNPPMQPGTPQYQPPVIS